MINTQKILKKLKHFNNGSSAWEKGIKKYAYDLLESLGDEKDFNNLDDLKKALLKGAENWKQYSYSDNSLCYNYQIAERLATPSELKKTNYGAKAPNANEDWLDVQARALFKAWLLIRFLTSEERD